MGYHIAMAGMKHFSWSKGSVEIACDQRTVICTLDTLVFVPSGTTEAFNMLSPLAKCLQ